MSLTNSTADGVNTQFEVWSTDHGPYTQDDTVCLNGKYYLSLENSNADAPPSSKWQTLNSFNDMWKYLWSKFRETP